MFQVSQLTEVIIHIIYDKSYNGKTYINYPDTTNDHKMISIGNINNKVIAVGGWSSNELEIFDIATNTWTTKTQFPFGSRLVCNEISMELVRRPNFSLYQNLAFIDMQ